MPIFNMVGGIGEYQYVETKSISNNTTKTISFNGAGIVFASGQYISVKKVNGTNLLTGSLFFASWDDAFSSVAAQFENGITIEYKSDLDYVYYKKI